jgi:hypothetical protein
MEYKTKKIVIVISVIVISVIVTFLIKIQFDQKKISNLSSQIEDLEYDLKKEKDNVSELEDKIKELEEDLSVVKHFDNDISSAFSSEGFAYTGNVIESQIDGEFNGWDGETIFKLTNGTIWQQSSYDYHYHYAYRPDLIIYKKGGTFYMKVEDVDDEIQVQQIR